MVSSCSFLFCPWLRRSVMCSPTSSGVASMGFGGLMGLLRICLLVRCLPIAFYRERLFDVVRAHKRCAGNIAVRRIIF